MSDEQSEKDQGFLPTKPQFSSNRIIRIQRFEQQKQLSKPTDFLARYISGNGLIRRQPQEVYDTSQCIKQLTISQQKIDIFTPNISLPKQKGQKQEPYKKYFISSNYSMVYSRYKTKQNQPFDAKNFCRNQINLSVLSEYKQQNFSVLKNFQKETLVQKSSGHIANTQQLIFDSKFESGNLLYSFQNNNAKNEYTLFIQNDTNTYGYTEWFYFSLRNIKTKTLYKFKIINFKKRHSFFKQGKKLAIFSSNRAKSNQSGWYYGGQRIQYQRSLIQLEENSPKFYKLSFELLFEKEEDYIMIAMNLPYSYTRLIKELSILEQRAQRKGIQWNMVPIAHSVSNNAVPYITITGSSQISRQITQRSVRTLQTQQSNKQQSNKKIILLLARQHPGQTWSSYLMQSLLEQLISDSQQTRWLLDNFIFKVFPMVNVDGVIYGNFRCDLTGVDLNRKWQEPSNILQPQIYKIRSQIQRLAEKNEIVSCFDLHGHSKAYNVFCYSCKTDNVYCRVLPYLISKSSPVFYFPSCTFGIDKSKIKTARAIIFKTIKNPNVLTIQCSFYGNRQGQTTHVFQPKTMSKLSKSIIQSMKIYYKKEFRCIDAQNQIKKNIGQILSLERNNKDDAGSQSDPSADEMDITQKLGTILPKKIFYSAESGPQIKIRKFKKKKDKKDLNTTNLNRKYLTIDKNKSLKPTVSVQKQQKVQKSYTIQPMPVAVQKKYVLPSNPKFESQIRSKKSLQFLQVSPPGIRFEQKKRDTQYQLPFYIRQQNRLMPLRIKKQADQIIKQSQEKAKQNSSSSKFNCFRVSAYKTHQKSQSKHQKLSLLSEQGLPILCILSDAKKKQHVVKLKEKTRIYEEFCKNTDKQQLHIGPRRTSKRIKIQMPKNSLLKNKDRSIQILTKIWRENLNRYGKQIKSTQFSTKI